jgi:hypothetical protein
MTDEDFRIKAYVQPNILEQLKVKVMFGMSYSQFLAFEEHAKKAGGAFVRSLVEEMRPQFEAVKRAVDILNGKE